MVRINRFVSIMILLAMALTFCGCENSSVDSAESSGITAKEILEAVVEKNGDEKLDQHVFFEDELFKDNCKKLYGIDYSKLADGGIICASTGGYADEISIIKLKDASSQQALSILQSRIEKRIGDFTGYKPQEIKKIEKSVTFTVGGFAVLIILDNADELKSTIESAV